MKPLSAIAMNDIDEHYQESKFFPTDLSLNQEDYLSMNEDNDDKISIFLSQLEINRNSLSNHVFYTIFVNEMSCYHWMKWCWIDSLIERIFQGFLITRNNLGIEDKFQSYNFCYRPKERSFPIRSTQGLQKVFFVRGVVKGFEMSLFELVHNFIYSMLCYRFIRYIQLGEVSFEEMTQIFNGSNKKGIDSLVQLLANLDAPLLRFFLTLPLIIGTIQGILSSYRVAEIIDENQLQVLNEKILRQIEQSNGFCWGIIREIIPFFSSINSLSVNLQRLELLIRWDGRLFLADRRRAFALIRKAAYQAKMIPRLSALQSLAKLVHSTGLKDLELLKNADYSVEEIVFFIQIKTTALTDLISIANSKTGEYDRYTRFYASYLLWWSGYSTSNWKQSLPFILLKSIKLFFEIYFLQEIISSVLEAIHCPNKQGFELGFGYPEWATQFTSTCFTQLIENEFRTLNLSDPVDQLTQQIPIFNLMDLNSLVLFYKNLTGLEMVKILTSIASTGAKLSVLKILDFFTDSDMQSLANYLNTSTIQTLHLGCWDREHSGGEGLTNLGLGYLTSVLPYTQITYLKICFPNIDNDGVISLAEKLNESKITQFYMKKSNMDDIGGQSLVKAITSMPITDVQLRGNITDITVYALSSLIKNNSVLAQLWIGGDYITDEGAQYFANMIQYSSSLNNIGIESNTISDIGIIALANSLKYVSKINQLAIGSQCGEQAITTLAQQLNQTGLWHLQFLSNQFSINSMEAISTALISSAIEEFLLIDNGLNDEVVSKLSVGLKYSSITTLFIYQNNLKTSLSLLSPSISKLNWLNLYSCNLTDQSIIDLSPYLVDSQIQELDLESNNIGDAGFLALLDVLPFTAITTLNLKNNNLTDLSATTLADIYLSTSLQVIYLSGNNISTDVLAQIESFQWEKYCQDQLCHANIKYNKLAINSNLMRYPFLLSQNPDNRLSWNQTFENKNSSLFQRKDGVDSYIGQNFSIVGPTILAITFVTVLVYKNIYFIKNILKNLSYNQNIQVTKKIAVSSLIKQSFFTNFRFFTSDCNKSLNNSTASVVMDGSSIKN